MSELELKLELCSNMTSADRTTPTIICTFREDIVMVTTHTIAADYDYYYSQILRSKVTIFSSLTSLDLVEHDSFLPRQRDHNPEHRAQ